MIDYQQRDQARDLYTDHDYSLKELEIKFNCKISDYIIQPWRREAKAESKRLMAIEAKDKKKAEALRLSKAEIVKFKAMSHKTRQFDLKSVVINIKQCPINAYLMRS